MYVSIITLFSETIFFPESLLLDNTFKQPILWCPFVMFKILLNREGRAFIKLYFCINTFIIFYHLSCITLDVDCIIYVTQY